MSKIMVPAPSHAKTTGVEGEASPVYYGHTSPLISAGRVWDGHPIRRARKATSCDYFRGAAGGGRCKAPISPGDLYLEGEHNDEAGGFGFDRYCVTCAAISEATGGR